jgi:hypothetical protein
MISNLKELIEEAKSKGFRPNTKAKTADGKEVMITSYPFTDGENIQVLVRDEANPSDWKDMNTDDLKVFLEKT